MQDSSRETCIQLLLWKAGFKKKKPKKPRETATSKKVVGKSDIDSMLWFSAVFLRKQQMEQCPSCGAYLQVSIQLPGEIFADKFSKNSVPVFGFPSTCKDLKDSNLIHTESTSILLTNF